MAGPSVIGALRVVLGADTGSFDVDLKKSSDKLATFGKGISTAAAAAGVAIAAFGVAAGVAIKHSIDEADKLGKMAQSIGIPVEELSRLKHAADLSGIGVEELGKSVVKLSKAMSEVAGGKTTGSAAEAFNALGISVKKADGSLKDSSQVMGEVADRFAKMEDGAGKTALAVAIFGKAGASIIPLLNQGSDAMRRMKEEADALGIVITESTAKSAEQFNDNLTRLGKVKDGIILKITAAMLPALEMLTNSFVQVAKDARLFESVEKTMPDLLQSVVEWTFKVVTGFKLLGGELSALVSTFKLFAQGRFAEGLQVFRDAGDKTALTMSQLDEKAKEFSSSLNMIPSATQRIAEAFSVFETKVQAPVLGVVAALKQADSHVKLWRDSTITAGQQVFEATRTPLEQYEAELEKLSRLLQAGAINQETFGRAGAKAAETLRSSYANIAQSIVGPLSGAFQTAAELNKKYAGAAKVAAIAEATINTYLAATKAYATIPPPFNIAAAAAVTAAGLLNVAKIKAQEFATGGSFKVGGSGGMDSQMVAFRASPGEMVDVRKPGQGSASEITVNMRGRDVFSKDMIRDLFNAINDGTRDGYRLKLAEV